MKSKEILGSGGILMVFMLMAKGIGALYRIPLTNIVGAEGMGLYQMIYPFYTLILTVASGGLPVAISKIVADKKNEKASLKVLKVAVITLSIVGALISIAVLMLRTTIARVQGNSLASFAYAGIAPAVLFVCIISCLRGYFQGKNNMVPSGISQIVEQVIKLGVGLVLASMLVGRGVEYGVFGALMGVSISEFFALAFLVVCFAFSKRSYDKRTKIPLSLAAEAGEFVLPRTAFVEKNMDLLRGIFRIALPVTLSSIILPLTQLIDSVLIVNILSKKEGVYVATSLYGLITGPIGSLINMPTVLTMSLGVALLPKVASSSKAEKEEKTNRAIKVAIVIALPFTLVFILFPREILTILYSRGLYASQIIEGAKLLRLGAISVLYIALIQVATSCLQGVDRAHLPAVSLIIAAVIKVMLTLILINFLSIKGAMIASVSCYGVTALIDYFALKKHIRLSQKKGWLLFLPFAFFIFLSGKILLGYLSFRYCSVFVIGVTCLIYALFVFGLKIIKFSDIFS